jgi:hypothetical protein
MFSIKCVLFWCLLGVACFAVCNGQTTDDCGITSGCFTHPANCKNDKCVFIMKWVDMGTKNQTQFEMWGRAGGSVSVNAMWLAIGFSKDNKMGDDCVVLCKHNSKDKYAAVQHYYNRYKSTPEILDANDTTVGLTDAGVAVNGNFLMCSFARQKQHNDVANYFDLSKKFFILAAYGDYANGVIDFHDVKLPSYGAVNFESTNVYSSDLITVPAKAKIHGCLMVFAWVFLASIGILIARYFKNLGGKRKVLNVHIWFLIHRSCMSLVWLISIASFLIILWNNEWNWVLKASKIPFLHSVFGMLTIGLTFIQPIMGFVRCDHGHRYRYVFDYSHSTVGILAIACAIVSIFLALFMDQIQVTIAAKALLITWCACFFLNVFVNEVLRKINYGDVSVNSSTELLAEKQPIWSRSLPGISRLQSGLIIFHIIISFIVSTEIIVWIATGTAAKTD